MVLRQALGGLVIATLFACSGGGNTPTSPDPIPPPTSQPIPVITGLDSNGDGAPDYLAVYSPNEPYGGFITIPTEAPIQCSSNPWTAKITVSGGQPPYRFTSNASTFTLVSLDMENGVFTFQDFLGDFINGCTQSIDSKRADMCGIYVTDSFGEQSKKPVCINVNYSWP